MAMNLFNNSIYLFESSEVNVFPCSYRGEFENNIIDPEARMLTERNFRVTNEKENRSYIDSINLTTFNTTSLNLSIDGYYFRIECSENLSNYITGGYDTFVISLGDVETGEITTPVLSPVYNSSNLHLKLDFKNSTDNKYYFAGLGLVKSGDDTYSGNIKLKVAKYNAGQIPSTIVDKDALASSLQYYQADDFRYKITGQQDENVRRVDLTLTSTAGDEIVTTKQNKIIDANDTFNGNNTFNGDNNFTGDNTLSNNITVNGNGAGDQGAATNKVDINVDAEMTKAIIDNAVITDLDVSQSLDATGVATFTNNVIVNGNGAGEQGANTNKVVVNVNADLNAKTTISDAEINISHTTTGNTDTAKIIDLTVTNSLNVGDASHNYTLNLYGDTSSKIKINSIELTDNMTIPADSIKVGTTPVVVPTYNTSNAHNVLSVNSNGNLAWINPYPVGSIYLSVNSTDPSTLFGGTWVQLKDRFLLGIGDTYVTNGATGGSATVTLSTSEIPSHSHYISQLDTDWVTEGNDAFYVYGRSGGTSNSSPWLEDTKPSNVTITRASSSISNMNNMNLTAGNSNPWKLYVNMNHKHKLSGYTDTTGSTSSHNNMPPYLVVYMWKRTA